MARLHPRSFFFLLAAVTLIVFSISIYSYGNVYGQRAQGYAEEPQRVPEYQWIPVQSFSTLQKTLSNTWQKGSQQTEEEAEKEERKKEEEQEQDREEEGLAIELSFGYISDYIQGPEHYSQHYSIGDDDKDEEGISNNNNNNIITVETEDIHPSVKHSNPVDFTEEEIINEYLQSSTSSSQGVVIQRHKSNTPSSTTTTSASSLSSSSTSSSSSTTITTSSSSNTPPMVSMEQRGDPITSSSATNAQSTEFEFDIDHSFLYNADFHSRIPTIKNHCDVSRIKSWDRGLVTEIRPRIPANCEQLKSNNREEVNKVKRAQKEWKNEESEDQWMESLRNCNKVVSDFSNNFYVSPEEVAFPLAYIFVVYTNPQQMVRLIKALWRPQNIFCIHPDAKQSEEFIWVFKQLSRCLDNVFLPTKLEKVYYQHHSIMDSQLNCYEDLLKFPADRWKYVINLCGRELPLKTNRHMVIELMKLQGASAVDSRRVHSAGFLKSDRFTWKAEEDFTTGKLHHTHERLPPTPIPVYKSFNFIAASRHFVNFFMYNPKAISFRNYLKDVKIPEEEFYATLVNLPGVPGGNPPRHIKPPVIDKYIWMNKYTRTRSKQESCEGRMVHFICIVSVGDLDQIFRWGVTKSAFFFNKYFMEDDHVVMDCMEEWLIQQNRNDYLSDCQH